MNSTLSADGNSWGKLGLKARIESNRGLIPSEQTGPLGEDFKNASIPSPDLEAPRFYPPIEFSFDQC